MVPFQIVARVSRRLRVDEHHVGERASELSEDESSGPHRLDFRALLLEITISIVNSYALACACYVDDCLPLSYICKSPLKELCDRSDS